ncbi:aminotransferase class IV [Candidatus Pelagibacter sp. Uisw_127]|uniref:aminotransferase class IV n=1 Tax=Candidatus Pelagibacter sp. Uisw_127 TaxID=3230988 RepID=UPI0039ED6277
MVTYLLKKSYQHKTLKEINFKDLWGDKGVFTTMRIFGKPAKILFFKKHIKNLIKSLKIYKLDRVNIEKDILKLIRLNIDKSKSYNHLLRVAINMKIISVSLRDRKTPKLKFNLKLINHKRIDPELKNLKYKLILKHLSKMDSTTSDVGLCFKKKILESGTSNMFFIKGSKIYSPSRNIYKGVTYNFFKKKLIKIINKEILISSLIDYDEILLIGSGKAVTSVETIKEINWKRKGLKYYKILSNFYKKEISKCPVYR